MSKVARSTIVMYINRWKLRHENNDWLIIKSSIQLIILQIIVKQQKNIRYAFERIIHDLKKITNNFFFTQVRHRILCKKYICMWTCLCVFHTSALDMEWQDVGHVFTLISKEPRTCLHVKYVGYLLINPN